MRKLIERIETPRGEKRGYIRLKPAIVAQHGDCAEKRSSPSPIECSDTPGLRPPGTDRAPEVVVLIPLIVNAG